MIDYVLTLKLKRFHSFSNKCFRFFYDLKTQASFVFLPQKFCGNPTGIPQKNFVILMGLPTFLFG